MWMGAIIIDMEAAVRMASAARVDTEVQAPPVPRAQMDPVMVRGLQMEGKVPGLSTEVAIREPEAPGLPQVRRQTLDREHRNPHEDEVLSRDGDGRTDCHSCTGVPLGIDG
ncbi:hypothetical protein ALPO108162_10270 [Alicyclobacillus pomorum]